jgi:hypothetical protein
MLFELTGFGLSESRKQSTGIRRAAEEADCFPPALEFVRRHHDDRTGFTVNAKWFAAGLVHVLGRVFEEFVTGNVSGHSDTFLSPTWSTQPEGASVSRLVSEPEPDRKVTANEPRVSCRNNARDSLTAHLISGDVFRVDRDES